MIKIGVSVFLFYLLQFLLQTLNFTAVNTSGLCCLNDMLLLVNLLLDKLEFPFGRVRDAFKGTLRNDHQVPVIKLDLGIEGASALCTAVFFRE